MFRARGSHRQPNHSTALRPVEGHAPIGPHWQLTASMTAPIEIYQEPVPALQSEQGAP